MVIRKNADGKIIAHTITLQQMEEASELQQGFCIACGATRDCCEPDARKYHCEECDRPTVYGAEELLMMGLVR